MIGDDTVLRQARDALSRRAGSIVLLTTPESDQVHELLGGAAAVWSELVRPGSPEDLVTRLASTYDVEAAEIAGHVELCLQVLLDLGMVEAVDER